jgi:glyoxylase-like metal-dependent hydrolase (beta-lactamase superfamily II)
MPLPPASDAPPAWTPRRARAGEWELTALSDGFMRLDGGSMWGVVPKAMWGAWTPAAEDNTILMALRPFLARRRRADGGDDVVVLEVGVGDRWAPKWRDIYRLLPTETLEGTLRAVGVEPEAVTHVVASHCHWDHVGAAVVERDGELRPRFPNARHLAPRVEVEMARHPDHARRGSDRAEDVEPLERSGLLETFGDERGTPASFELLPGLRAHLLGGHSDGVSVITLNEDGEGDTAIFWSDVVPTAHHVQPPYIMAYDIDVVRSFEVRSEWLARAAQGGWIGLFYHDVDVAFARLAAEGKRYEVEPL